MTAQLLDLKIEQGADFNLTVNVMDSSGDPFDLTDFSAYLQLRSVPGGTPIDVEVDFDLVSTPGVVEVSIPYAETELLDFSVARYDLLIQSVGASHRLLQGNVSLSRQISVPEV